MERENLFNKKPESEFFKAAADEAAQPLAHIAWVQALRGRVLYNSGMHSRFTV
jgi:hypothetical protein